MPQQNNILVKADPQFLEGQSSPSDDRYVFAYTITISNEGTVPAKLLSRQWLITDSNGKVQEVRGDGVVGEQPFLQPGDVFQYTSGAILETPVGVMQGKYYMQSDLGEKFEASIPRFTLSIPRIIH